MVFFKQKELTDSWDDICTDYEKQFDRSASQDGLLEFQNKNEAEEFFISQIKKKREFFFSLQEGHAQEDYNFISCDQVFYTGKLEDIRKQMEWTLDGLNNKTDHSGLPEHLKNQDLSKTGNLLNKLIQMLSNLFKSQTQVYREKIRENRKPAMSEQTVNDERRIQSNSNDIRGIRKFIAEFINSDCVGKNFNYRKGYAAKVNSDNSISISFPSPEKEFEFFKKLAEDRGFTLIDMSGNPTVYAKNGCLYSADTNCKLDDISAFAETLKVNEPKATEFSL